MSSPSRASEFERRLQAHFATLRTAPGRELLRRSAARWQLYAAVTGSVIAMATGVSASDIRPGQVSLVPPSTANEMPADVHLATSGNIRLFNAIRLAGVNRATVAGAASQTSQAQPPTIAPGGVVPLYSTVSTIQTGEWISIYGSNLANQTAFWNNDFPQTLGGTSVMIDNKPAYLLYVSPGQINLQVPDDTAAGSVTVTVTTSAGSASAIVTMAQIAPSFSVLDTKHVAGIILRANHSGAWGGGTFDIVGPTGDALGYRTVAVTAGDDVVLFAFGLGPTTPAVPAGQVYSGAAPTNDTVNLYINNIPVKTTFAGISSAGVYQINLRVPYGLGTGDVPLLARVGGAQTQPGVVISLEDPPNVPVGNTGTVVAAPPVASTHQIFSSFPPTFSGSASSMARKAHFEPRKLKFNPK